MIVPALLAAACAQSSTDTTGPPAVIAMRWDGASSRPPDRLVIRWTPLASDMINPRSLADKHCLAWNRYARPVRERVAGDAHIAEFVCTPPDI